MQDESDKVIVCERGDLVFVYNFHPTKSYQDYRVGCKNGGRYKVGSCHSYATSCPELSLVHIHFH